MSQERKNQLKEWYCPLCGTKNQSSITTGHTAFGLISYCEKKHPYEFIKLSGGVLFKKFDPKLNKPTLTKEQIEAGYHIWTEFELEMSKRIGSAHWKDCPCNTDV